ncbi:pectin lyase-like protein [Sarocladium strictum]
MRFLLPILCLLAFCTSTVLSSTECKSDVLVHPKPDEVKSSTTFNVKVRPSACRRAKWQSVPLYQPQVQEINATTGSARRLDTSLAYFDYDGFVSVSVTPNKKDYPKIDSVRVRPLSYNIQPSVKGREITFDLREPHHNVVVEINGDVFNVLHIWTNTIDKDPISESEAKKDEGIIFFGPGYHDLDDIQGVLNVTSGQTVYLAGGAAVHGAISVINATNVSIRGRGMLFHAKDHGLLIDHSENIHVEGISVVNPGHYSLQAGSSRDVTVKNFRGISAVQWGDGVDLFCMKDSVLEGLFMRTSDDSLAIYQHRWNYYGDSNNITIRDSSFWADVAHAIHIGLHGNTVDPETMSNVTIQNIDIMDHREPQVDFQGAIAINSGDENMIENISFEDIHVEDFRIGMLLQMRVTYNAKYNQAPGRGIRNVTFKNMTYSGTGGNTPLLVGYSPERAIEFVDFQGLKINGKHVYDGMQKPGWYLTSDSVPMIAGPNVRNLTFSS